MARVGIVMYDELPGKAKELRSSALEINNEVINIFQKIDAMKADWYGQSYSKLGMAFNELIPLFNEILKLTVTVIPMTLEQVANNYAVVDTGSRIVSVVEEPVRTIPEVNTKTEPGFRFIQSNVEEVNTFCIQYFDLMKEQMDTISSIIDGLTWESDASEVFRDTYAKLKQGILQKILDVKSKFASSMKQMITSVQTGENNNMVGLVE